MVGQTLFPQLGALQDLVHIDRCAARRRGAAASGEGAADRCADVQPNNARLAGGIPPGPSGPRLRRRTEHSCRMASRGRTQRPREGSRRGAGRVEGRCHRFYASSSSRKGPRFLSVCTRMTTSNSFKNASPSPRRPPAAGIARPLWAFRGRLGLVAGIHNHLPPNQSTLPGARPTSGQPERFVSTSVQMRASTG